MRSSGASVPERFYFVPNFGPLGRLFGLSAAFRGEYRPLLGGEPK